MRRRTVALVGPFASTAATSDRSQNARIGGAGSAAATRMSRSPAVSFLRRTLPAGSTLATPGTLRSFAQIESA